MKKLIVLGVSLALFIQYSCINSNIDNVKKVDMDSVPKDSLLSMGVNHEIIERKVLCFLDLM